ncbi:hypothetical protein TI39_contig503g00001 [Zymoseptoria brevis]|uniref:Uncharacterized protein n=1 Tax=Zymoseptoria brevis TaxID=1047168 RepID=A0A0F4GJA3_9PEZI|nr:hypothetical protein TI39_contig503g00001 [Zymoseptoria brevis]
MAERNPLPAASTKREGGAGRAKDKLETEKAERKEKEKMEKEEKLDCDVTMADANHEGEELVYEHGGGICVQSEDETEAEPIAQERNSLHETTASYRNNTPKSEKVVASSRVAKEARPAAGEETGAALQALVEGKRGHTPRMSWTDSSSSPKKNKHGVLPPQLSSMVPANQQPTRKQGYTTTTIAITTTSPPPLISLPSTPAPHLLIPLSPTYLYIPPPTLLLPSQQPSRQKLYTAPSLPPKPFGGRETLYVVSLRFPAR